MDMDQFYRAVLDLANERSVAGLLDAALGIAKRMTRAGSVQIEIDARPLGAIRRTDDPAWTCAHATPAICVATARGTLCLRPAASSMRVDRPSIDLLTRQVSLVLDVIARNEARIGLRAELRELRDLRVQQALERNQGNVAATARQLQVARSYIYDVVAALRRSRSGV
jgi:hypothetical protein